MNIRRNTLLLVLSAGFCDAITFTKADELFSAHVTGNFILFAYDLVNGADFVTWVRLLTFPVFLSAVLVGGWIDRLAGAAPGKGGLAGVAPRAGGVGARSGRLADVGMAPRAGGLRILRVEAVVLVVAGLLVWGVPRGRFWVALMVVFAMGLQNAFGKLYSSNVYAPTTMMTGNVTQAALNLLKGDRLKGAQDAVVLFGFLAGCFLGVVVGKFWGLQGIVFPGLLVLLVRKGE